jgi:carboxylesterase
MKNIKSKIMLGAEPLFIGGSEEGFLFIHGFTGSPFEGREIALKLNEIFKFTVSVPLLPGHGTTPVNLKGILWIDWYNFVEKKLLELKQKCQKVFICGQSIGGALALRLAANQKINGFITLAGAAFLKDWRLRLLPIARHIIQYQHKSKGPDIRNNELKKIVPTYHKYPIQSIYEVLELLTQVRKDLYKVTAPALLLHSPNDRTIHFDNLEYIYNHISSQSKERFVLEKSYHVLSIDVEKEIVFNKIAEFIKNITKK